MDDTSLAEWLRLRELADWKSRSAVLTSAVTAMLPHDRPVHVLDLATGTGSNFRFLLERLPRRQRWLLVDRSEALLAEVVERTASWADARGYQVQATGNGFTIRDAQLDCHVERHALDLGKLDAPEIFAGRHLVTASALLDLVSAPWLRLLAARCSEVDARVLFTITYDGRSACIPPEPEDDLVRRLFNDHQNRDKGLGGPAEGPRAAGCAQRCFADAGYHVLSEPSDWILGPDDAALQRPLIDGWAEAALEMAPQLADPIAAWRSRRHAHVNADRSHIVVGHRDVVGSPRPVMAIS
jgi:hypothetical protein